MTAPTGAAVSMQDAVYTALAADTALAAWLGATVDDARIYEVLAPADRSLLADDGVTPTPYVTLQGGDESGLDVLAARGFEVMLRVRVWVPGTNERLGKTGAGHVRRVLDGAALVLAGHVTASVTVDRSRPQTDPDGQATQVMVDIRAHAQVTS